MLNRYQSICQGRQKIIVSKDSGSARTHRALNVRRDDVRHYRIDGYVIDDKTVRKCDFLLLNDTKQDAYLIEVKGKDILSAIEQLEQTEKQLREELKGYHTKYRIVYRSNTHAVHSTEFKKFYLRHHGNVKAETDCLEEEI